MHVVLLEPEIPQNTGNIARTCAATGCSLHLIKPLGFSVDSKYLKRAGLDYWDLLDIHYHENFEDFTKKYPDAKLFMATTKAIHTYDEVSYDENNFIVFGKETAGIPEVILKDYPNTSIRIPMKEEARSLNLSNSVAIVVYEALRQQKFQGLLQHGKLREYDWNTKA
jgi:tRNA (cytidine/uridine-2'-O-)-methyltransferase